jgi:hypothetical protein
MLAFSPWIGNTFIAADHGARSCVEVRDGHGRVEA